MHSKSRSILLLGVVIIGILVSGYYYWKQASKSRRQELLELFQNQAITPDYQEYIFGSQLPDFPESTRAISLDSSSRILAVVSNVTPAILLYDIDQQGLLFTVNIGGTNVYRAIFSPVDNKILYTLVKEGGLLYIKIIQLDYASKSFTVIKSQFVTVNSNIQVSPVDAKFLLYNTSTDIRVMSLADYTTPVRFTFANSNNMSISKNNNYIFVSSISTTATDKSMLIIGPLTPQQLVMQNILNTAILKSTFSYDNNYILSSALIDGKNYIQKHAIQDLLKQNTTPIFSISTPDYSSSLDINSSDTRCIWNLVSGYTLTIADFVTGTQLATVSLPLCTGVYTPYIAGFTSKYIYSACTANLIIWKDINERLPTTTLPLTTTQPLTTTTSTSPLTTTTQPLTTTTTSTSPLTTTSTQSQTTQPLTTTTTSTSPLTTTTQPLTTTTSTNPLTTTSTSPLTTTSTLPLIEPEYIDQEEEIPIPTPSIYKALIPAPTEKSARGQGGLPRVQ